MVVSAINDKAGCNANYQSHLSEITEKAPHS